MSDYAFYAAMLRFVARKTERDDPRIAAMMDALNMAAAEIDNKGGFLVPAERLELTARAFAGVAAFLQKQILPEVVVDGNTTGEQQVRWAVEAAMHAVKTLLSQAVQTERTTVEIHLDQPPD